VKSGCYTVLWAVVHLDRGGGLPEKDGNDATAA
jgi:hypothetical protein